MKIGTAKSYLCEIAKKFVSDPKIWDYDSIAKGYQPPTAPPDGKVAIPTWKSELYFEYHRGVMTTQAGHKRHMRNSEEWALNAEKVASLAWLDGDKYPDAELNGAWENNTLDQFHDVE